MIQTDEYDIFKFYAISTNPPHGIGDQFGLHVATVNFLEKNHRRKQLARNAKPYLNKSAYAGSKVLCKFFLSNGARRLAMVSGKELTIPGTITGPLSFKLI